MTSSIESVLENLLSDNKTAEAITGIIKEISTEKTDENQKDIISNESDKNLRLQRKIDLITALIPYLGQKNADHIKFIIKILMIAKLINELNLSN